MNMESRLALFGVIGHPLGHSLSPAMHNAAFSEKGIQAVYLAFETLDPEGAMRGMRALGIRGMSVTHPHKREVVPFLDEVDDLGRRTGAVNTVLNVQGRLKGFNTDGAAVIRALEEKTTLAGKTCLIIGAGGAAWAAGFSLKARGVRLLVTNRTSARGESLASALSCPFVPLHEVVGCGQDVIIQATPVGMYPETDYLPVPEGIFREGMVVMDMVYNPMETPFLKAAGARGSIAVSGRSMFVYQGAEQFRLWTGLEAPLDVMRGAVETALRKRVLH
ncbi:MAG: shikimate dehydrogenase [Thermodesulfobacteriota bacterium]